MDLKKSNAQLTETSSQIGTGYAHSKIILMGEHSVVYDYPAIALPFTSVGITVHVQHSSSSDHQIDCQYFKGPLNQAPKHLDNLKKALSLTLSSLHIPQTPLAITIHSTIPQERGMGSSAAVIVALIRALSHFYQRNVTDYQLQLITNQAEVIAHESTSGIDSLITASNHAIIYQKSQTPRFFQMNLNAYLVVADSGMAGKTSQAVSQVAQLKKTNPEFCQTTMKTIGHYVRQAYHAIHDQDIVQLGRLMSYNHYYLNQLGVSNRKIDQIVNAAWLAGSLGAKLTGGGLGGCVIALAQDYTQAKAIEEAMQTAGASQTWALDLALAH